MIRLKCIDCGEEFGCNGDKECMNPYSPNPDKCYCRKCSDNKDFKNKDFPNCYNGIKDKERVEFN